MTQGSSFRFTPSPRAWQGAAFGVFIASVILIGLSTLDLIKNNVSLGDAAVYFAIGSLITALIGAMLVFTYVLFANISTLSKWTLACFALLVYYFFIPTQTTTGVLFIGIWAVSAFSLTFGALWSLVANKSENGSWISTLIWLLIGLLAIFILVFWLHSTDSPFNPPKTLEAQNKIVPIPL